MLATVVRFDDQLPDVRPVFVPDSIQDRLFRSFHINLQEVDVIDIFFGQESGQVSQFTFDPDAAIDDSPYHLGARPPKPAWRPVHQFAQQKMTFLNLIQNISPSKLSISG